MFQAEPLGPVMDNIDLVNCLLLREHVWCPYAPNSSNGSLRRIVSRRILIEPLAVPMTDYDDHAKNGAICIG